MHKVLDRAVYNQ